MKIPDWFEDDPYEYARRENKTESFEVTIKRSEVYELLKVISESETGIPLSIPRFKEEYDKMLEEGYDNFLTKLSSEEINKYFPKLDVSNLHDEMISKLIKNNIEYVVNHIDEDRMRQITDIITGKNKPKKLLANTSTKDDEAETESRLVKYSKIIIDGGIGWNSGSIFINEYFTYLMNNNFNFEKVPTETKLVLSIHTLMDILNVTNNHVLDNTIVCKFIKNYSEFVRQGGSSRNILLSILDILVSLKIDDEYILPRVVNDIYDINLDHIKSNLNDLILLKVIKNDCLWLYEEILKRYNLKVRWYHKLLLKF